MKSLLALVLLTTIAGVNASATKRNIVIDCAGAPAEAIVVLPEILEEWAEVRCTIYGHVIFPTDGWRWSTPNSWGPVFFPAQRVKQPIKVHHQKYFSSITFQMVDDANAKKAFQQLQANVSDDSPTLGETYQMVAQTESGDVYSAYFFDIRADSMWAYSCTPECRPDLPFIVSNISAQ